MMQHDGGTPSYAPATIVATWPKGSFTANVIGNAACGSKLVISAEPEVVHAINPGTALRKLGEQARARNLQAEQRSPIIRKGVAARWKKS